jgi:hypothetical protein
MSQVSLPQIELLLKVLGFFGLWQPETTAMKVRGFLAQLVFLLISVVFPLINYFYFNGNLENVGVHMALYFATNLKIRILMWQMDDFINHIDDLKDLMEFTKSDKNPDRIEMKKYLKFMERLIKFFFGVILIINSLELINAIRYRQVPYTSWIPPHHPLVIAYIYPVVIGQVILTTFDLSISLCFEVLPITFIGMASVLLVELSERMESFSDEKTDDKKDYLELKTCVQHHLRISDYVKKTEELFSIMLFIQGFFHSLYLCFFIYFLSKVRFDLTFQLRLHVLWISSDRRDFYFHHTVLDLDGCHSCHISAISNWTASDHRVREVE